MRALASLLMDTHSFLLTAFFCYLSLCLPVLLLPSGLLSYIFVTVLSLSILTACPIHSNLFLLIAAAMSRSFYSSLNSWLVLILHIPCSSTGPFIPNIFLPCTQSFHILSHSPCFTTKQYNWFHHCFTSLNFNCFTCGSRPNYLS